MTDNTRRPNGGSEGAKNQNRTHLYALPGHKKSAKLNPWSKDFAYRPHEAPPTPERKARPAPTTRPRPSQNSSNVSSRSPTHITSSENQHQRADIPLLVEQSIHFGTNEPSSLGINRPPRPNVPFANNEPSWVQNDERPSHPTQNNQPSQPPVDKGTNSVVTRIPAPAKQSPEPVPKKTPVERQEAQKSEPEGNVQGEGSGEAASENWDVMISYSHADTPFMRRIKDFLDKEDIKVWVDEIGLNPGTEFLAKIGKAIVDSTTFLSILTSDSVTSKYCRDEFALAYVSNKPIFPLALEPKDKLFAAMDFGQKLTMSALEWSFCLDQNDTYDSFQAIADLIKQTCAKEASPEGEGRLSHKGSLSFQKSVEEEVDFWEENFKDTESVDWSVFEAALLKKHNVDLDQLITQEEDKAYVLSVVYHELKQRDYDESTTIHKEAYIEFCGSVSGMKPFWYRIQEKVIENYTIKEVFNVTSSVRIDAIENLGKFNSSAVREALLDLLADSDANVRAVAAISLARTGIQADNISAMRVMKLLRDPDRLVRESACLALGRMKAESSVSKLTKIWRNDVISTVRDAAELALRQIGGEEASKAMHMTNILSSEIKKLTT